MEQLDHSSTSDSVETDKTSTSVETDVIWTNLRELQHIITELVETERSYVKSLDFLKENYVDPLREETFLTETEFQNLFGNIEEILQIQKEFLQVLEEATHDSNDNFTSADQQCMRKMLFSVGKAFLMYAQHFRVYGSFCAKLDYALSMLGSDSNPSFTKFQQTQNPQGEQSIGLESLLIKPLQRITKYPLLLQQMCKSTNQDTDEHHHLTKAMGEIKSVTDHVNDMQKVSKEFGASFEELSKQGVCENDIYVERPDRCFSAESLPVFKSGYCVKEGWKTKSWKKRYFIVNDYGVFYYVSEQSEEPLNHIPKSEIKSVRTSRHIMPRFGKAKLFEVETEDRTFFIQCDTYEELKEWMYSIQRIISQKTVRDSSCCRYRKPSYSEPAGCIQCYKSGYCVKEGGMRRSWKRRYFVVTTNGIYYFVSDQSVEPLRYIPKSEVINVKETQKARVLQGREHVFEVKTCGRTFYVQCSSHKEVREWITAVRHLVPKPKIDLSVGEIIKYGTAEWCNITDSLRKIRSTELLETHIFVFKSGVVLLCKNKNRVSGDKNSECRERFRTVICVKDIHVKSENTENRTNELTWDLVQNQSEKDGRPERVYRLRCPTVEEKVEFVSEVRKIIRDHVRSMTLPKESQAKGKLSALQDRRKIKSRATDRDLRRALKESTRLNSDSERSST